MSAILYCQPTICPCPSCLNLPEQHNIKQGVESGNGTAQEPIQPHYCCRASTAATHVSRWEDVAGNLSELERQQQTALESMELERAEWDRQKQVNRGGGEG